MAVPVVSELSPSDSVRSISTKEATNKRRKIIILMRTTFFVHATGGVYLAEESETECDPIEQNFPSEQEDELYDVYENWCTNWKRGCRNCRSTASTKKPKHDPRKRVKASTNRRNLKTKENVQSNAEARKANNERRLQKRHLQRFGYEIYHRKTDGITNTSAQCNYVPHKLRRHHTGIDGGHQNHPSVLQYELKSDNVSDDLSRLLVELQHRDLTPEDYEILLRLDEKVAPKTVSKSALATFDTLTLESASTLLGDLCSICMEVYSESQCVKTLPCQHTFHDSCINTWLSSASLNCPLDGIAVQS